MIRTNPFVALDDFVLDRVAQPVVNRFPGVPLPEQVRFCVMGAFAAWAGRLTHSYNEGHLDAAGIALGGIMLGLLCVSYAGALNVSTARQARNPNRINPVERATRTTMLVFAVLSLVPAIAALVVRGWSATVAYAVACNIAHAVTFYAAACDNPPPPTPKAATAPAGA